MLSKKSQFLLLLGYSLPKSDDQVFWDSGFEWQLVGGWEGMRRKLYTLEGKAERKGIAKGNSLMEKEGQLSFPSFLNNPSLCNSKTLAHYWDN